MNSMSRRGRTKAQRESATEQGPAAVPSGQTEEFVNHGMVCWNQTRRAWTAKPVPPQDARTAARNPADTYEVYAELYRPSYQPFSKNVPLAELIHVLLDVWEQVRVSSQAIRRVLFSLTTQRRLQLAKFSLQSYKHYRLIIADKAFAMLANYACVIFIRDARYRMGFWDSLYPMLYGQNETTEYLTPITDNCCREVDRCPQSEFFFPMSGISRA